MIKLIESYISESKSEERTVRSLVKVLLIHMLKCKYQYEYKNKSSWIASIINSHNDLIMEFKGIGKGRLFNDFYMKKMDFARIYTNARDIASLETKKDKSCFPEECEWTLYNLVDDDFINSFIETWGTK